MESTQGGVRMYGNNLYGTFTYSTETQFNEEVEISKPDLMKYVPRYYNESNVVKNIFDAYEKELAFLHWQIDDLQDQFFIDTATWGLDIWEKEWGIHTDHSKPYEERREVVKAKMRGRGTTTKEMIKNVAEAFSGGEVEVIEDNENYSFTIQFVGIKGIPRNMQDLINTLKIIKPAHLGYTFKYTFTVWNMVSHLTWGEVKTQTWNELRIYEKE